MSAYYSAFLEGRRWYEIVLVGSVGQLFVMVVLSHICAQHSGKMELDFTVHRCIYRRGTTTQVPSEHPLNI